jgi:hypothetical protein
VALDVPFPSKVTRMRVAPSFQTKRASLPGCDVRSDMTPSVSHRARVRSSTNAANRLSSGTSTVLDA